MTTFAVGRKKRLAGETLQKDKRGRRISDVLSEVKVPSFASGLLAIYRILTLNLDCTYLKRVLITEIKHEHVRCRTPQSVITKVRPFQMRADREIRDGGQIGDL